MHLSAFSAGWYRLVLTVSERKSKNKGLKQGFLRPKLTKDTVVLYHSVGQANQKARADTRRKGKTK